MASNPFASGHAQPGTHDGWVYLLPPGPHAHLVCVDDDGCSAEALAPWCDRLTVICVDSKRAEAVREQVCGGRLGRVDVVELTSAGVSVLEDATIDGVVLNFIAPDTGFSLRHARRLVSQLTSGLVPEGFVCALMPNRCGYSRLRTKRSFTGGGRGVAGVWGLRRWMRRAGVRGEQQTYPLVIHDGEVAEVMLGAGYRSYVDYAGVGERLREHVLGPHWAPWLAPGLAIVAFRGLARPNLVECLSRHVEYIFDGALGKSQLKRFLVLRRKIIVSLGFADETDGRVIVVPRDETDWVQRRNEVEILFRLGQIDSISARVPRVHGTGVFEGRRFSVLQEIRGVCVDGGVDDLEQITATAAQFVGDLGRSTIEVARLTRPVYDELFGDLMRRGAERHPAARELLEALDDSLWLRLRDRPIPTVVEHGDFKIENVIIDRHSREPRAVIDWEIGRLRGLPAIDLIYLLVYNRMLASGRSFARVCRGVVIPGAWSRYERALLGGYLEAVPLASDMLRVMTAIFPVHCLALRFRYDMGNPVDRREVLEMLSFATASVNSAAISYPFDRERSGTSDR